MGERLGGGGEEGGEPVGVEVISMTTPGWGEEKSCVPSGFRFVVCSVFLLVACCFDVWLGLVVLALEVDERPMTFLPC